jgi:hypothetical protein
MFVGSWPSRRRTGALTAGFLGLAVLAGCGSEIEGEASPGESGTPSSSTAESTDSPIGDLSAGLLPADAFPAGAVVTPVSVDELTAQDEQVSGGLGGLQDVTVTPESCAPAVGQAQPGLDDMDALAAQSVTVGATATVEVLAEGPAVPGALEQFESGFAACPAATITSPQIGTATVAFQRLEVPDLGDGSAAMTMTMSLPGPGGAPLTVPIMLGVALQGDRLVYLTTTVDPTDPTAAADPAAFGLLLQQAFDHQADALG